MAGIAPKRAVAPAVRGQRFAVVVARFNEPISKKLLDGALGALAAHAVTDDRVEVHRVPGSFELGQAAMTLARSRRFAGVVCVGVVIKGATPHFDYVCSVAAQGIARAGLDTGVPVTFGVITALTEEQAWERAGGVVGNRGEEAALAALEMAAWQRARRGTRAARAPRRGKR